MDEQIQFYKEQLIAAHELLLSLDPTDEMIKYIATVRAAEKMLTDRYGEIKFGENSGKEQSVE